MEETQDKPGYLARYGLPLLRAGYAVVPIKPGGKFPGLEDWQTIEVTEKRIERWLSNGHARDGVGVRTRLTPAVDIDTGDEAIATAMDRWCQANLGMTPVRVGQAPKRLLPYRTLAPFRKVSSRVFLRPGGNPKGERLEVLADGQQFVAYAVHPDTKQPYTWLQGDSLADIPLAELPMITEEQARAAAAEFERLALAAGWQVKPGGAAALPAVVGATDPDDPFADDVAEVVIGEDELRELLMAIPNTGKSEQDYDTWVSVGMALHHHWKGADDGLEMWREWSAQAGKHIDAELDKKWPSFAARGGRAVKTARYIIQLGREAQRARKAAEVAEIKTALRTASSLEMLREAARRIGVAEIDRPEREALVGGLRAAFKRVEDVPLSVTAAKAMIAPAEPQKPAWLRGWVYLTHSDEFFNVRTGQQVTATGFNALYSRNLGEQDLNRGEGAASAALTRWAITVVENRLYAPGEPLRFNLGGKEYVNSYNTRLAPPAIKEADWSDEDRESVERVDRHFEHLLADRRERELVKSWLAHVVQTGKRPNWAVLMQGAEGDGKTFLLTLMGAVLGSNNVKTVSPHTLKNDFSAWAEGSLLTVIEEVRLAGHNRHDILNAIKPLITNPIIEVHPKRENPYNIPNTAAYLLLTNYMDALPLSDNDSRYFVVCSRWQNAADLKAFMRREPEYYDRLFEAVDQAAGALRGWLEAYELHAEFNARRRAPWSKSKSYMVQMARNDEVESIESIIENSTNPIVSKEMLSQSALIGEVADQTGAHMSAWSMKKTLSGMGYRRLGQWRVAGEMVTAWSMAPELFETDGAVDRQKVWERLTGSSPSASDDL